MINVKIWSLSNKFMLSHKGNNYFKKWVYRCLVHVTFITVYRNNEQVVYTHVPWLSPPRAWVGGEYNPLHSWQTPINTPLSNIKSPSLDQLVKIHTIQTSVGHRSPLEFQKSSIQMHLLVCAPSYQYSWQAFNLLLPFGMFCFM